MTYDSRSSKPIMRSSDAAAVLGWQGGSLTYVDEPLRVVVARINRYSNHNVRLDDPALGELHFTGTVFQTQVEEWALGLQRVFPIHAVVQTDGSIALTSLK